ncbi:hypothetical protein ONC83_003039 [Listeria monocytogenes]|nr:hypothetical protein [Listeria monocytogenes]
MNNTLLLAVVSPISLFSLFQIFCAISVPILLGYRYFFHNKKRVYLVEEDENLEEIFPKDERGAYPWETEKDKYV